MKRRAFSKRTSCNLTCKGTKKIYTNAAKQRRYIRMPRQTTGDVSDILTGSRPIYREARNEHSHSYFAWGSGSYDDQITRNILDSTTATIDEEDNKEVQRL